MVKFDEKGQAYWDFISENCTEEFMESIQNDIDSDYNILHVDKTDLIITVYLGYLGSYVIHAYYVNRDSFTRNVIYFNEISVLSEVLKNAETN